MLKIISREEDGIGILQLRGKLIGPPETDDLHTLVRGMLDRNMKKFVIDLTYVSWMGSLGIGALIRCLLTVRSVQGEIHFAALGEKVISLFEITKLIGVIHSFNNVGQAVAAFNGDAK
jgi:anti-sigma B factor antagonist